MKITVGGSLGMTVTNIPYSPIKVDTTLLIEKEVDDLDGEALEKFVEDFNEKIEAILHKDLEKKMSNMAVKQKDLKRKIERM